MVLLELYFSFLRIGFTSFGGISMIPLILEEMEAHSWMTAADLSNLIGIAEMTPGPMGLNCATFAGIQTAGLPGCLAAVLGVLTPTLTLTLTAALLFEKFRGSRRMSGILRVIKPMCIAMILIVIVTLSQETYMQAHRLDWYALGIAAASFVLLRRFQWPVPWIIVHAAGWGLILYGVLPRISA